VVDEHGELHRAASAWLAFLASTGRSPNTVRSYGAKIAWYLAWTAQTSDWRRVTVGHIAMWQHTLLSEPFLTSSGAPAARSNSTVRLWIIAVRAFYEWADSEGMLATDLVSRLTRVKYFAPGTPGGGEFGSRRRVLIDELRLRDDRESDPEWIDDAGARSRLETLSLRCRDRLLVDLLYFTGIRAGEALSLFRADLHMGGGSRDVGCHVVDPHFHVRLGNPVENGARAKGAERVIYASEHLVERYVDYLLERDHLLAGDDRSPHVFVNAYSRDHRRGQAMTYAGVRKLISRCGDRIGFPLRGPHILRHTFATRLVRGIDCDAQPLDVVQALLGHRSITSTRVYTHDLEAAKKTALAAVAPRSMSLAGRP
jgi:site-specific recombinase XerD